MPYSKTALGLLAMNSRSSRICSRTAASCLLLLGLAAMDAGATLGTLSGAGTAGDPYQVADYADLSMACVGKYSPSAHYRLVADLDASASDTANNDSGLVPIVLLGSFHGGGHTISTLSIHRSGHPAGLFASLGAGASVDSLGVVAASIVGSHQVGALAASNQGGSITACHSSGMIIGDTSGSQVGGLVGANSGTIRSSYSSAVDSGDAGIVGGGLVGWNKGTIAHSHAFGTVTAGRSAGGLVGANRGTIDSSFATGAVSGTSPKARYGGLVGISDSGRIHNCYATGAVSVYGDSVAVGGLVGLGLDDRIDSCYATGGVTADADHAMAGGLVGQGTSQTLSASHATGAVTTTGMNSVAGGLVGVAWGDDSIGSCYATGGVTATGGNAVVGGLVGRSAATLIEVCYAIGAVTGTGYSLLAGGLVGLAGAGDTVSFCSASGPVTATGTNAFAGGLVGLNKGMVKESYAISKVVNSESSFLPGGLVGNDSGSILACYWGLESASSTVGVGYGLGTGSAVGLIAVAMKLPASFPGWDFDHTWIVTGGDSVPHLRALAASYPITVSVRPGTVRGPMACSWILTGKRLTVSVPGAFEATALDVSGRVLASTSGAGTASMDLSTGKTAVLKVRTANQARTFLVPLAR